MSATFTMPTTVPVSVLAALATPGDLSDLNKGDPPLIWYMPGYVAVAWHPLEHDDPPDGGVFFLPQSSAALRRVLARHLGWTLGVDEVPPWLYLGASIFSFGGKSGCDPIWYGPQPGNTIETVPALAGITDPMEALAAVLVHVADQAAAVPS